MADVVGDQPDDPLAVSQREALAGLHQFLFRLVDLESAVVVEQNLYSH